MIIKMTAALARKKVAVLLMLQTHRWPLKHSFLYKKVALLLMLQAYRWLYSLFYKYNRKHKEQSQLQNSPHRFIKIYSLYLLRNIWCSDRREIDSIKLGAKCSGFYKRVYYSCRHRDSPPSAVLLQDPWNFHLIMEQHSKITFQNNIPK